MHEVMATIAGIIGVICREIKEIYSYFVSSVIYSFILCFILDPFLVFIDIKFFTERFSGLGFSQLLIITFTLRLIIGHFVTWFSRSVLKGNRIADV
jgi:hypothetical protein